MATNEYDDYDPTDRVASTQSAEPLPNLEDETVDYSSSDTDSDEDLLRKTRQKGHKVYHMNQYTKLDSKMSLHMISNQVQACEAKQLTKQSRNKDKSQRATVEQVLDPRTRLILLKLLNNGVVNQINGCLSTGKEANVYHARSTDKEYAIKIYKTSILIFKDRERYVEGEFRFRNGPTGKNPRKMVKMWAEKELRNLKRLQGKIPCPVALVVKSNVLVMDFIGKDMKAAPKLKDIDASRQQYSNLYLEVVLKMRILFQECKLIHADLSEYNMLYYNQEIVFIDVSQSVQNDHPHSMDFLRRDIVNINDFFSKKGVHVFSSKRVFEFIVSLDITKSKEKAELDKMIETAGEDEEDASFDRVHIPRNLQEISVDKVERDIKKRQRGEGLNYQAVTGLAVVLENSKQEEKAQDQQNKNEKNSQESSSDSESDDGQSREEEITSVAGTQIKSEINDAEIQKKKRGDVLYQGMTKLQRKHKVKEDKRLKRQNKIPKHVKRQKTKKN